MKSSTPESFADSGVMVMAVLGGNNIDNAETLTQAAIPDYSLPAVRCCVYALYVLWRRRLQWLMSDDVLKGNENHFD